METLIGKGEKRIDAYDKVTGKGLRFALIWAMLGNWWSK